MNIALPVFLYGTSDGSVATGTSENGKSVVYVFASEEALKTFVELTEPNVPNEIGCFELDDIEKVLAFFSGNETTFDYVAFYDGSDENLLSIDRSQFLELLTEDMD